MAGSIRVGQPLPPVRSLAHEVLGRSAGRKGSNFRAPMNKTDRTPSSCQKPSSLAPWGSGTNRMSPPVSDMPSAIRVSTTQLVKPPVSMYARLVDQQDIDQAIRVLSQIGSSMAERRCGLCLHGSTRDPVLGSDFREEQEFPRCVRRREQGRNIRLEVGGRERYKGWPRSAALYLPAAELRPKGSAAGGCAPTILPNRMACTPSIPHWDEGGLVN